LATKKNKKTNLVPPHIHKDHQLALDANEKNKDNQYVSKQISQEMTGITPRNLQ